MISRNALRGFMFIEPGQATGDAIMGIVSRSDAIIRFWYHISQYPIVFCSKQFEVRIA